MKKIVLFLTIIILTITKLECHAQSFDGGLTGGVVTSQIQGDGYGGFHQLGFTAGLFGRIPGTERRSWQVELKYSLYGAHSGADEVALGMNPMSIRLHYIELPIMFRYNLSGIRISGRPLDFITLEVGVSNDFLMRGTQSADFEDGVDNPSWLFYSLTANVGLQFDINKHLGINVRSMNNVTPCRFRPGVPIFSWFHYYNIALQATVVYTIIHAH